MLGARDFAGADDCAKWNGRSPPASRQGAYPLSFDLVAAAARMAAIARQFCYVFVVFTLLAAIFLVRHHAGT